LRDRSRELMDDPGQDQQTFFDAFSSPDLVHWTKHPRVLDTDGVDWAHRALWAPSILEKDGRYYLFFSANDLQRPGGPLWDSEDSKNHTGGIGVAVADSPEGPYRDHLGAPLIGGFHNDAQPIDQFVFRDDDGTHYLFYGGWGDSSYRVAYAIADSPGGPFDRIGTVLEADPAVAATGAGHNSVLHRPGSDDWYIV
jgi:beta-xylosidase